MPSYRRAQTIWGGTSLPRRSEVTTHRPSHAVETNEPGKAMVYIFEEIVLLNGQKPTSDLNLWNSHEAHANASRLLTVKDEVTNLCSTFRLPSLRQEQLSNSNSLHMQRTVIGNCGTFVRSNSLTLILYICNAL